MKNQNIIVACAVTAVVAGGIGFWGNNLYSQSQRNNRFGQMGNRLGAGQYPTGGARGANGSSQPGFGMMRSGALSGEVVAKDDKSITLKLQDGSSKIVLLSSTTTYRLSTDSKLDDVAVGKTVSVLGTPNTDGSTTATNIELNPIFKPQGQGQK